MTGRTRGLPRRADLWMIPYLRWRLARVAQRRPAGPIDVLFCICDHYEPDHGGVPMSRERERVAAWIHRYPATLDRFRDADGRPPQHTFFFPAEVYRAEHLDDLTGLCARGYGEVEVHLHHANDTAAHLTETLEQFKETLAHRHGLLSEDRQGRIRYAFIHGNWSLDNGRLDDRYCGVNNEISVLLETGCYADLTMPAAPDAAQSRIVNSIYYASDDPERPRSYDRGVTARVGAARPSDTLLMIQGPLSVYRKRGIVPALENGALDASPGHHPTLARFRRWVNCGIAVAGRPEWVIVKVYSHGAKESNADVLLGPTAAAFHEAIGREFNDGHRFRLHYVTAREIANIVHAAEAGQSGNPNQYRDYELMSRIGAVPPSRANASRGRVGP